MNSLGMVALGKLILKLMLNFNFEQTTYDFNTNLPFDRYNKCQTLKFKNGPAMQKHPFQAIRGTKFAICQTCSKK